MKNSKFKHFIFALILVFFGISMCLVSNTNNKQSLNNVAYAFTTNTISSSGRNGADNPLYTEEGNIPFSLYTTRDLGAGSYEIIEYFGTYSSSTTTESGAGTIYHYTIDQNSIPYIMLSSKKEAEKNHFYDQTLVFKFNDADFAEGSTTYIPNNSGYMSIYASVNGTPIYVDKTPSASTDNTSVVFQVNLQPLGEIKSGSYVENTNCACPFLPNETHLGGDGIYNDVSYRTGLYEFRIEYSYKNSTTSEVSNKCVFETSFYVVNYNTYVEDSAPITFTNTDTFIVDSKETDYELFNYNYVNAPTVEIDATKFAPSFLYTTGFLNYNFSYLNFNAIYTRSNIASLPMGTQTGNVILQLENSNLTYAVPTYKTLPKTVSGYVSNSTGDNPFADGSETYFYDDNGKFNIKASGNYFVWVDDNNNAIYDSGDWFYLEKGASDSSYGYNAGTDYLWKDVNNNGVVDTTDIFYCDLNNNGAYDDSTEPYETYTYGLNNIQINYLDYNAKFDLQDFETNFLVPNKINSTFLGTYSFNLDFLIQNALGGYSVFSNSLVPSAPTEVTGKKLLMFGYNLKYYDQDTSSSTYHQNVELKNNSTWANYVSYNIATAGKTLVDVTAENAEETGNMKNIPTAIAITNQAPLRFDYFGNLAESNYTAKYYSYDYKSTTEESILDKFSNLSDVDRDLNMNYYQGAAISSDGIKIMKLAYNLNIVVNDKSEIVTGCQYFAFEINNTVQSLYIQAIDYDTDNNVVKAYDFNKYTNKDVRVGIEYKPNTFLVPANVTYFYYRNYSTSTAYTTGRLSLKTTATGNEKYVVNSKTYNYYVTNNNNKYSFTASGTYKIVIKDAISNVPVSYFFTIDKENFNGIEIHKIQFIQNEEAGTEGYAVEKASLSSSILSTPTKYVNYDIVVSNEAFTLGWNQKPSGAQSYSYVYFMEMQNSVNLESALFEVGTEFWLTNGYKLSAPSGGIDTYLNYKSYEAEFLRSESYFNKDGLYIFYVYDEAGNFFTRCILIDRTLGKILQGYWDGSSWVNNFDPTSNPANYVNVDTTLYFGTHKAINLPDMSVTNEVSFEDHSYTRAYNLVDTSNPGAPITEKEPIHFDLYENILNVFTSHIKNAGGSATPKIKDNSFAASSTYYLTLSNTLTTYKRQYEDGVDASGAPIPKEQKGTIDEIYFSKIYKNSTTASVDSDTTTRAVAQKYKFFGEAQYKYVVTNENGTEFTKNIEMNFDVVRGTFWAHEKPNNSTPVDRLIRKNSGTNLDVLKFVYDKIEGEIAEYYTLKELKYTYYEFVLDDSSVNFADNFYPFSKVVTKEDNTLLSSQVLVGNQYVIDDINLNASGLTQPGKYIITRTYVGGNYEYDAASGTYYAVEDGGSYYKDSNDNYINLFEDDTLVRKYVVYVDHYGIITTEYMVRNDGITNVREVGNFISLTLNKSFDDEWNFKEFFLTTNSSITLNTNKVPVQINIPLSKFFVFYNSNTNNLYAKQAFAQLSIIVSYQPSPNAVWEHYEIDGYNSKGMCTCSKLTSTNGELIFTAAGKYRIRIEDHTGYLDNTSNAKNADNLNPTTLFGENGYVFTISHTSPTATAKQKTFNYTNNVFNNEETLENNYNNSTYATNIKQQNFALVESLSQAMFDETVESGKSKTYYVYSNNTYTLASAPYSSTEKYYVKKDNNEFLLTWFDPLTPYEAKIKQIDIKVYGPNNKTTIADKTYQIDLASKDGDGNLIYNFSTLTLDGNTYTFANFSYISYFKVVFYNNISSPAVYDNQEYYRYTYKISLNIEQEYKYEIKLSYISSSRANQSYVDENGNSYADADYTLYIDRTKPNTNIDPLLRAETYLTSSGYYTTETRNNFKEENFEVSLQSVQNTPSAFSYSFAVPNNFSLTYNAEDTMPYFFVRSYNKYNLNYYGQGSNYPSITPDMIDSVYNDDKAYYDKNLSTKFPAYYPRFSEISGNIIAIGNDTWYRIDYKNNVSLKNLIAQATNNNNPVGFYEIIERDLAGNYRCYTVYFNEYSSLFLNLNIDGYTQQDRATYLISTGDYAKKDNISANIEIELTELSSHIGWGTLTVKNETSGIALESVQLTPFIDNYDTILSTVNNFLQTTINSRFSFKLATYNSNYTSSQLSRYINFNVNGQGKLGQPVIEEYLDASTGLTKYNVVLENYNNARVLYLEEVTLNLITNAQTNPIETTVFARSTKEDIPNKITDLSKGVYKIIFKDNFNSSSYYHILHVGEMHINNFNREYNFELNKYKQVASEFINENEVEVYYSGGNVYVTYESNMYNVYVNNILYSGTAKESDSTAIPQCKTFTLSPSITYNNVAAKNSVGGYNEYLIEYKDKIDGSKGKESKIIRIYNVLPEMILKTAFDGDATTTLQESINETEYNNSVISLNWGHLTFDNSNPSYFQYISLSDYESSDKTAEDRTIIDNNNIITVTLHKKNDLGEYSSGVVVPRGQEVTEEGFYKLVLTNSLLNNAREIYFVISFKEAALYSVFANEEKLISSPYETFNLTYGEATGENNEYLKAKDAGSNPSISIISCLYNAFPTENIDEATRQSLLKQLGITAGTFNENNVGIANLKNIPHYYSIYTPKITYNRNINISVIEFTFKNNILQSSELVLDFDEQSGLSINNRIINMSSVGNDYWTTIFLVYNLDGPIRIEFFAFTKAPKTSALLENSFRYLHEETNENIEVSLGTNPILFTLTNKEIKNSDITLSWKATKAANKTWYNQGNIIVVNDKYGYANAYDLDCSYDNEDATYATTIVAGSGVHQLTFKDVAGNIHEFASNTYYPQKYYTLNLIDSVIYHINVNGNDKNSIQYAVFNDDVNIVIDNEFIAYYSDLNITIVKNGISYRGSDYRVGNTYTYKFSDPGKYTVTLSAYYGTSKLLDSIYNFTIISKTSARLAFEFVEINGYEVKKVIRSEQDITESLKDSDGKILSLFITSNSEKTGNGYYTITLKYGKHDDELLTFSMLINDFIPTISCNIKHGETTTSNIVITYNPSIIYEQLGECYIKVLTYNNDSKTFNANPSVFTIDANSFTNTSPRSFTITRSNSYFIQVETKSGNIVSSFRVNKKDPLNTIAIIIIIVAAIAVTVLIIIIIKLRTRMRIK